MRPELGGGGLLDIKEIFMRYYDKIIKLLIYITSDPILSEDLAQEVFIKLYENPLENEDNVGAWLAIVAKRTAYNYIRSENRRMAREGKAFALKGFPSFTPFQERDDIIFVRQVLKKLEDRDRSILILKYSGYSYKEIAKAIGVKKTSVGTLLARAQRKFAYLCKEEGL